jgi:hypothetical protein
MKIKQLIIIILIILPETSLAQKMDSVRQVVKAMGYALPRLSPIPESVKESKETVLSLNGQWEFSPAIDQNKPYQNIQVPGEWVMQGFTVKPGTYAEYRREVKLPSSFRGNRIKLRCDAVYSECIIFVNGKRAGEHLGGFTAFETDITDCVNFNKVNVIAIRVRSESIADSLSSGSQYAVHPLGGISRKLYLMALPDVNCSMFHVSTAFDENYTNARLSAEVELANESGNDVNPEVRFELRNNGNQTVVFSKTILPGEVAKANSIALRNFIFEVPNPLKWDTEHPNLYSLKLSLVVSGKIVEVVTRIFGFKQTEVRGNQLFVNNMPVKLRGVCRHEVMPLRGRSLAPGQWEEDVNIFRAANVNYIRTSHYPPAPELLDACDRLGMFVEVEGPFCWAEQTKVPKALYYPALIQPELEMVNTFRSNPSVLMWSIANESGFYKEYFSQSAALIKAIDPTRPRNFSQYGPDGDNEELEIGNHHYPGPKGPEKYADSKRPITFDEYCHLNAYNRFELVTDPGIRDAWGIGFEWMWNNMYYSKGVLGGSLWAAIDDAFFLPDGRAVGYGTWGPVDGWRRPKPEYWHVKKVYSPVKISQAGSFNATDKTIKLEIENRMLFSNLDECRFFWKAGEQSGTFKTTAKPRETAFLEISVPATENLYVEVSDPRGVVIDQYMFTPVPELLVPKEIAVQKTIKTESSAEIRIVSGNISMVIDKASRMVKEFQLSGETMMIGDAKLMLLPLNGKGNGTQMKGDNARFDPFTATCTNRVVEKVEISPEDQAFKVRIFDKSREARGYAEYVLANGVLHINYIYEVKVNINPRQVGLVFALPDRYRQLEWSRLGQWNYYPDDQIGRLSGTAVAINSNPLSGPAGPMAKPDLPWASDQNELGTNDFRSTKMNITKAALTNGSEKDMIDSDGTQSVRCWLLNGKVNLLVASYSNMGAEGFFRGHAEQTDRPLKPGDLITGSVQLSFVR